MPVAAVPKLPAACHARQVARPQVSFLSAPRPSVACFAAAEESAEAADSAQGSLNAPPQAVTPAWQEAIDLLQSGDTFTTAITAVNKSGVLVTVGKLTGFIPYKLMNRAVLNTLDKANWTKELIGRELRVKVRQVVVPERRLVCSEKAAMLDDASRTVAIGDIFKGNVTSLHSFGAFVELTEPAPLAGTEVILPLREISWDWIATVNERLVKGQEVTVCVVDVKPPPNSKVVVSLKRLQEDPLKETLDKVMPLEGGNGFADVGAVPANIPSGVEDILDELSKEDGVREVTLGRCVEEKRTVSQDLELWMSREQITDGYNLVARAGRMVQEIHVATDMSAGEMREAVQRVLTRVN